LRLGSEGGDPFVGFSSEPVASSGTEWEGMVLLQPARLRRSLLLQNALENGHFAALGAGLLSQLNHTLPPGASGWS